MNGNYQKGHVMKGSAINLAKKSVIVGLSCLSFLAHSSNIDLNSSIDITGYGSTEQFDVAKKIGEERKKIKKN